MKHKQKLSKREIERRRAQSHIQWVKDNPVEAWMFKQLANRYRDSRYQE